MTSLPSDSTAISQTTPQLVAADANSQPFDLFQPKKRRLLKQVSLRYLVMGLFLVPLFSTVGLTTWLSIRNSHESVHHLADNLQAKVGNRVVTHLNHYLSVPKQINQINLDAEALGILDLEDFNTVGKYFWKQMQVFNVGYINYANQQGEFIGVERLENGQFLINETLKPTLQQMAIYQTDRQGNRLSHTVEAEQAPIQEEEWYAVAVAAKQPIWSPIYQWTDKPEVLSISSSYPVYGSDKKLVGVIGVDLILSQISQFLSQLDLGTQGRVFLVEQDGRLIAKTGTSPVYTITDGKPQRLTAENSPDPLIQAAARHIKTTMGGFAQVQAARTADFTFDGQHWFAQVLPWQDQLGLNWRIVVVTSESEFMSEINANTRNTIILSCVALLIAVLLGLIASRWITDPMIQLSRASQAVAQGDLDQKVDENEIGELGILAQSFNQMVQQLRTSFNELEETNKFLEQRVSDRTATLQAEGQLLQQEVEHLLEVVSAVEEGDLTAEAEVSPHVTGLVADTLNRLIERLGQIMATVLSTAEQVTQGAEQLEQLAMTVANDTQQQTQAVVQVQDLMENVNMLSLEVAMQAAETSEAVEQTRSVINQGHEEISAMTQGIQVLQQGTEHIVKRTQTLSNYVELAAQFTKDQRQIAAMTRILAVNASMLANRASAQQDPEQMAIITREFETIAAQVNQLASQTNQSLVLLQQRTNQMQTVVSGLNYDVEEISQQVENFTNRVEHSQQAFDTIQAVSERVAQMGARVTQSSQVIVDAAQTTLQSVQQISTIATESSGRANITQEQAKRMEHMARILLQKVAFFHLHSEANQNSNLPSAIAPTALSQNS